MLQVENGKGALFLVMSQSAYDSLDEGQLQRLSKYNALLPMPIPTIETLGGGSARCMMAEIFLKKENINDKSLWMQIIGSSIDGA